MIAKHSFQIRTYLILLISLGLVVTLGFWAYNNLSGIVNTVSRAGEQDVGYVRVKEMLTDISNAESSVKSYSLIPDTAYLDSYYESLAKMDDQLTDIEKIYALDSVKAPLADTLRTLVEMKMLVLDELIDLQDGSRLEGALDEVTKKVSTARVRLRTPTIEKEEVVEKEDTADTNEIDPWLLATLEAAAEGEKEEKKGRSRDRTKEKKGWFGRSKRKKRKEEEEQARKDSIQVLPSEIAPMEDLDGKAMNEKKIQEETKRQLQRSLRKEITQIKSKTIKEAAEEDGAELMLIGREKKINDEIRKVVNQIESLQQKETEDRAGAAGVEVEKTNRIMVGFTIFVAVFLILLALAIWDYIRKNNRYQKTMEAARVETERLAQSRERFLANMSHEIRTPMNAILGFSEQLMQSELKPRQGEQIRIVRDSSAHLLELLNSILDYSRLESSKMQAEEIPFSLSELLDTVVGIMQASATKAGIGFGFIKPQIQDLVLTGDPIRLRQILFNLLSNAIKFTPEGEVGLRVFAEELGPRRLNLKFEVYDTGIGIPPEKQELVFQAFEQSETSTQRRFGGTGLGLAISRQLVELLGGTIALRSEVGLGTTFTIDMKFWKSRKSLPSRNKPGTGLSQLKGKRVLVADDEEYNRRLMGAILGKWNMEYVLVGDGEDAIQELDAAPFDLVILDFRMPGRRGDEVASLILSDKLKTPASVPVIAMTAATHPEELAQLTDAGVRHFLPKPFREEKLRGLVGELFGFNGSSPEPSDVEVSEQGLGAGQLSLDELRRLTHGNEAFLEDMLVTFVKTAVAAQSDMQEAFEKDDLETLGEISHRLIPPTRHLNAKELSKNLKAIEFAVKEGKGKVEIEPLLSKVQSQLSEVLVFLHPYVPEK